MSDLTEFLIVLNELLGCSNRTELNHSSTSAGPVSQRVVCCCVHTEFVSAFDVKLFDSCLISGLRWADSFFI